MTEIARLFALLSGLILLVLSADPMCLEGGSRVDCSECRSAKTRSLCFEKNATLVLICSQLITITSPTDLT